MTDVWGAISIPLAPAPSGVQAAGDPCLWYIGDFLRAFLSTDENALAQWDTIGVAKGTSPVNTVIVGRPDDRTRPFSAAWLPALFIFRSSGAFERWGDDWDVARDKVTLLWVLPISGPEIKRAQLPFANALVKAIYDGIELGRTPSWVQPNDPDPDAATLGSLLYTYGAFVHLLVQSWRPTFVRVDDLARKAVADFAAVELTCELVENLVLGTDGRRYHPTTGADMAIASAKIVEFQSWTPSTPFATGAYVVPPASNGLYYVCTFPGTSAASAPVWPIGVGQTVSDGTTLTWRCVGSTSYTRWTASTLYALGTFVVPQTENGSYYQVTTPGESGASSPTFPTTPGATVTDGSVVWTCVGPTSIAAVNGPLEEIVPLPV